MNESLRRQKNGFTPLEKYNRIKGISLTGFTLIELIIVIIIIGVLVRLAIPYYNRRVEDTRQAEAISALKDIHSAQMRYAVEYDQYTSLNVSQGGLDIATPVGKFFDFDLLVGSPSATTIDNEPLAKATRKANPPVPSGCTNNYYVNIYENGILSSNYSCGGGACFLAGVLITMADGTQKPIEQIQAGDIVLAFNENTAQIEPDTVTKTFSNLKEDVYFIINHTLKVTPLHPILSKGKWVKIKDLKIGDTLTSAQGEVVAIFDMREVKESVEVYNFQTNPLHTYIANGFIVHNKIEPIGEQ